VGSLQELFLGFLQSSLQVVGCLLLEQVLALGLLQLGGELVHGFLLDLSAAFLEFFDSCLRVGQLLPEGGLNIGKPLLKVLELLRLLSQSALKVARSILLLIDLLKQRLQLSLVSAGYGLNLLGKASFLCAPVARILAFFSRFLLETFFQVFDLLLHQGLLLVKLRSRLL